MKQKHPHKTKPSSVEGKATSASTGRGRLALTAVLTGVVAAIVALQLSTQKVRHGWPEQLTSGSARGFNVLLITLDTTRSDRLGCYGHDDADTPVLDGLAAGGLRFDDAVTVTPITLPSHATILTGLNPPNHGVRHNAGFRLAAEQETIAELLSVQGYETAAFLSAFVLNARFGLDQGFDHYDDRVSALESSTATAFTHSINERSADRTTDAAVEWLNSPSRGSPFFCWVHYFDPHNPYQPPPEYARRFADQLYDGEIAFMDSQIGRLLEVLEANGVLDDTLTIVVADHGESLGEHGEQTHAKLIYGATMRVPLIVSCPTLIRESHVVDDVLVSVTDVFPTVLDLLGIPFTHSVDGRNLRDACADRDRIAYQETLAPYLDNGWSPLFGLRRHKDKYILAPRAEYYDLDADPGEMDNLFADAVGAAGAARDDLVTKLSTMLAESPAISDVVAAAIPLDVDAIRRLESLGYVGSISKTDDREVLLDPKDVMAVQREIDHAGGLARSGRYDEALRVMKRAAAVSPRDPTLLLTMGKTYLFMDRIPEAEETFRTIHSIRPSARVCILLAQIMLADRRLEEATEMLDQAEVLDPHHGGIYLARGDLLAAQGRPDEAIASYNHAREVDPYRASMEAKSRIHQLREFMRKMSPP